MSSTSKSAFWRGVRHGLPFLIVVMPFAALFGVLATEAGMALPETLGFSVLIIAGAAQFAALQQMIEGAPLVIVILTALAVNLRMAMYSAALVPHRNNPASAARRLGVSYAAWMRNLTNQNVWNAALSAIASEPGLDQARVAQLRAAVRAAR